MFSEGWMKGDGDGEDVSLNLRWVCVVDLPWACFVDLVSDVVM